MARFTVEILLKNVGGPQTKAAFDAVGAGARGAVPAIQQLTGQMLGFELSIKGLGRLAAQAFAGFSVLSISRGIIEETKQAQAAMAQLEAGVRSTGGAAGFTADQLSEMADGLSRLTGVDDEVIAGGEALLLTFRRISGEAFPQTMKAALDLSARFGKDLNSSVVMIAKALEMPVSGLTALRKAGVQFSDAQKEVIKGLVETGKLAEAQALILKELEIQFGGSAVAARDTMGGALQALKTSWGNLLERVGSGGGTFRQVIEGMVKGLDWLTDHWHMLEGAVYSVLAGITGAIGANVTLWLYAFERAAKVMERFIALNPFIGKATKDIAAGVVANISNLKKDFGGALLTMADEYAEKAKAAFGAVGKGAKGLGAAVSALTEDTENLTGAQAKNLQVAAQAVEAARRERQNAEALLAARRLGTEAMKLEATAQEALAKARAAGAGASAAQRLEIMRSVFATAAAKQGIEAINEAEKEAQRLFAASNERMLEQVGILVDLANVARDFLVELQKVNAEQVEQGAAQMQEWARGQLDFARQVRADLLTPAEIAQARMKEIVENVFLHVEEKERALARVRSAYILQSISQWSALLSDIGGLFGGAVGKMTNDIIGMLIKIEQMVRIINALNSMGGGGGGGGWWGMLKGLIGGGGGSSVAVTQGTTMGSQGAVLNFAGSGAGTSGAAWSSWGTLAAYGFLAWVGFKIFEGFTKAKFKWKVDEGAMRDLQQSFRGLATDLGLMFAEFNAAAVRIEKSKEGFNVRVAALGIVEFFRSYEEAIAFAKVQAIKFSDLTRSASAFVRAAISASRARTIEALQADIDFARMLETQNLPDIGKQIADMTNALIVNARRVMDLFASDLPNMVIGLQSVFINFSTGLHAAYNSLMGIEEDPKKVWERNKEAYNAQLRLTKVQLALLYAEIQAKLALIAVQSQYLPTLLGGGPRSPGGGAGRPGGGYAKGGQQQYMDPGEPPIGGTMEELYNWILAFIQYTLAQLPGLITGGMPRGAGRRGGGGRQASREGALGRLEDMRAQAIGENAVATLEYTRALRAWREEAKEGKLSAAELAEGERLLAEQRERALQDRRKDIFGDVAAFAGISPFAALKNDANALRDNLRAALKDGTLKWREFKAQMDLVNAAERERMHILEQETLAGTMEWLARYVTDETLRVELLQQAAIIKFELEYASLIAQTELLRLQHVNVELLDRAIANIGNNLPQVLDAIKAGVRGAAEATTDWLRQDEMRAVVREREQQLAEERARAAQEAREEAARILADWRSAGEPGIVRDLREFGVEFNKVVAVFGRTADVMAAANGKLDEILSRYLDPIRAFREGRQLSNLSTLTGEGQYFEAQSQFRRLVQSILGGDLAKLDQFVGMAQRYGELAQGYTAGEGLRFIMKELDDAARAIENAVPGIAGAAAGVPLGAASNPMSIQAPGTVTAINATTAAIHTGNDLMLTEMRSAVAELRTHTNQLNTMNYQLSSPLSVRNVA